MKQRSENYLALTERQTCREQTAIRREDPSTALHLTAIRFSPSRISCAHAPFLESPQYRAPLTHLTDRIVWPVAAIVVAYLRLIERLV